MDCFYHQETTAVGQCKCGKSLCRECMGRFKDHKCEDCKQREYQRFVQYFEFDMKNTKKMLKKRLKICRRILKIPLYVLAITLLLLLIDGMDEFQKNWYYLYIGPAMLMTEGYLFFKVYEYKKQKKQGQSLSKGTKAIVGELKAIRKEISFQTIALGGGKEYLAALLVLFFLITAFIVYIGPIIAPIAYFRMRKKLRQTESDLKTIENQSTPTFEEYVSAQS